MGGVAGGWLTCGRRGQGRGARGRGDTASRNERRTPARLRDYLLPLLAVIPAILLAAAQLLPTLELNGLGLRTGGLPYRQAVSFSLRPRLLAQSLLPPFGRGLDAAFGSEGYAEFVGYVGIAALVLAGVGLSLLWRRTAEAKRPPWNVQRATLLAASGFLLALGAYNPLYYLLWRVIPGFDLFRAPARWLELFALGVAALAAFGLDALASTTETRRHDEGRGDKRRGERRQGTRRARGWGKRVGIALAVLLLAALIVIQQRPPWLTLAGWAAAGVAVAGLLWAARRWPRFARGGLVALTFVELWLGARALPFTLATAPAATSLRNAPAALLAATQDQPPAGRDRFLSLSDIRFDPGDLAELRASQAGRLSPDAVERLVRAAKQVEVIAPNLPLLYNLPAVDGYDGGLLPLGRYVQLQSLFLPPELLMPDGRLREQLRGVPDDRLLDLTGVRFVITDKQRDLWADDVYYDLELGARLEPGQELTLDLSTYPPFPATALGVVAEAASDVPDGTRLAELIVTGADGREETLDLRAGPETRATPAPVRLRFADPLTPISLTVRVPAGAPAILLRGISLIDERTGAHSSVTVSQDGDFRRIHSGDVKIYERTGALGRAWLVHGIQPAADDAACTGAAGRSRVRSARGGGAVRWERSPAASTCRRKRVGTDRRVRARTGGAHRRCGQPGGARPGRCLLSGLAGHGGRRPRADPARQPDVSGPGAGAGPARNRLQLPPRGLAAGCSHQSRRARGPGRGRRRDLCPPEAQTMTTHTAGVGSETDPRLLRIGFSVLRPSAPSRL